MRDLIVGFTGAVAGLAWARAWARVWPWTRKPFSPTLTQRMGLDPAVEWIRVLEEAERLQRRRCEQALTRGPGQ